MDQNTQIMPEPEHSNIIKANDKFFTYGIYYYYELRNVLIDKFSKSEYDIIKELYYNGEVKIALLMLRTKYIEMYERNNNTNR